MSRKIEGSEVSNPKERKNERERERDVESVIQLSLWMNQPAEKRKRFL